MSAIAADDLAQRIEHFLREQLGVRQPEVGRETGLVSSGTIDSVDLVRIAAFLENETGLEIPDADVTVENFDSIRDMVSYVVRHSPDRAC